MTVDLSAAAAFLAGHGRVLDRRRFDLLTAGGQPDAVVAAVDGYRNADGGYGWGLEPDLRSGTSQPGGALHALEAFADLAPATTPRAAQVCDWLASVTLPDGGLPFALPVPDPGPWLQTLGSTDGSVTVVAPPGSPRWTTAAVLPPHAAPEWRPRAGSAS